MGLKIKRVDWEWYIPEYLGNRARYDKGLEPEPMQVEIRIPTFQDTREVARLLGAKGRLDDEDNAAFFARHVRGIKGLEVDGEPVTSGQALIALANQVDSDLIAEINRAINSYAVLQAGLGRSSASAPTSPVSSPATDGTATIAGGAA